MHAQGNVVACLASLCCTAQNPVLKPKPWCPSRCQLSCCTCPACLSPCLLAVFGLRQELLPVTALLPAVAVLCNQHTWGHLCAADNRMSMDQPDSWRFHRRLVSGSMGRHTKRQAWWTVWGAACRRAVSQPCTRSCWASQACMQRPGALCPLATTGFISQHQALGAHLRQPG